MFRATRKDIAGLVGVSLTTVSNVVHGNYDRVSPQTVQRILAAIDELHYVPNMSARALVSHSSRIIAYVDTHSPQETYAGNGFAGVMLSGLVDFVKKQGKPCVTINTYLDDPTLIQVRAEDRRGGYLAAKHLIDLGHRNILFIGAVHCGFMNNDQRYAGYCDALEEAGIAPNPDNLMTNLFPFNAERGIALGRQLAARRDFTGICVSGDQYAAAVITGLREGGARVPEDVSIVGFDDVDIARMTFPPLTTIHQDGIGKGRRAAEAIFALIDGENPDPKDFNLPVELVVRGTTAKAK